MDLVGIAEKLCGHKAPFRANSEVEFPHTGMGLSQLNELLLSLGYDRVSENFFAYLCSSKADYDIEMVFQTIDDFDKATEIFRVNAMLRFGNIKYAFKQMCYCSSEDIQNEIDWATPKDTAAYESRHEPLHPIQVVPAEKTFLLGYLVDKQIQDLSGDPETQLRGQQLKLERDKYRRIGEANHIAYLASDHMDVYVATSMREPHEYLAVNRIALEIFSQPSLNRLRPRFFDPTQAYCVDRIDKGIAEALMLKRAKCTVYLAQESDTLGKDSELASTLAQGKPVIAYVPKFAAEAAKNEIERAISAPSLDSIQRPRVERLLNFAKLVDPKILWNNAEFMEWFRDPANAQELAVESFVANLLQSHYDKRADTLKERHPLGIQVNIFSGVANGVLVARTVETCAELIRRVMTNSLKFKIDTPTIGGRPYLLLRETLTDSVFRVVSGDETLTNTFWNFYVER